MKKEKLNLNSLHKLYDHYKNLWNSEIKDDEAAKYWSIISSLPKMRYKNVWQLNCSHNILSALISKNAEKLLVTDTSQKSLKLASNLCEHLDNITFRKLDLENEIPDDSYDLIVISEVACSLSTVEWKNMIRKMIDKVETDGYVILEHMIYAVKDYEQSAEEIHEHFGRFAKNKMKNIFSSRTVNFRIDVWKKQ